MKVARRKDRGRRTQTSKGGNRGSGQVSGAAGAMGIWAPRMRCVIGVEAIQQSGRR